MNNRQSCFAYSYNTLRFLAARGNIYFSRKSFPHSSYALPPNISPPPSHLSLLKLFRYVTASGILHAMHSPLEMAVDSLAAQGGCLLIALGQQAGIFGELPSLPADQDQSTSRPSCSPVFRIYCLGFGNVSLQQQIRQFYYATWQALPRNLIAGGSQLSYTYRHKRNISQLTVWNGDLKSF